MSSKTCPNCGVQNPPNMSFCSNCGNSLATVPQNNAPNVNASDLPPTMISYQPNLQANPTAPPVTPSTQPPVPPKKGNKGLILGLVGCGGLLVLSVIGLVVAFGVLGYLGVDSNKKKEADINISPPNSNVSNTNGISNRNDSPKTDSTMLNEFQKLKQVGEFKQTYLKSVPAKDFFPSATEAAQASYYNGKKYVISTLGKFPSNSAAFDDFDTQIKNIKADGGQIYSNESKNNTKAAFYKYKNYYFIEACGDAVCSRNNSDDRNALSKFAVSFGNAVQ